MDLLNLDIVILRVIKAASESPIPKVWTMKALAKAVSEEARTAAPVPVASVAGAVKWLAIKECIISEKRTVRARALAVMPMGELFLRSVANHPSNRLPLCVEIGGGGAASVAPAAIADGHSLVSASGKAEASAPSIEQAVTQLADKTFGDYEFYDNSNIRDEIFRAMMAARALGVSTTDLHKH